MDEGEREALILLAYLLVQHGRLEKAETLLAALAEVFPQDRQAPRLLADCLLKRKKYQEALEVAAGLCNSGLEPAESRMAELFRAQALWGLISEGGDFKAELDASLEAYLKLTEETGRTDS